MLNRSAKKMILLKKIRFLMIRNLKSQKMIVAQRMKIQTANQTAMNRRMIQAMMKKMILNQMTQIHLKNKDCLF